MYFTGIFHIYTPAPSINHRHSCVKTW